MRADSSSIEGVRIVKVLDAVEIDIANAEEFKRSLLEAIDDAPRVVLDLGAVEFFDSAGMGALLSIQKRARERGGEVVLAGLRRAVMDLFRMVGFDVMFVCLPDTARGVARLRS